MNSPQSLAVSRETIDRWPVATSGLNARVVNCLAEAGVPIPWFSAVETPQALQRIVVERGRDLVIKPVDSRGSRGVQRLSIVKDLSKAFLFARSHSPTERVMVEQYLDGPQVSTESVVVVSARVVIAIGFVIAGLILAVGLIGARRYSISAGLIMLAGVTVFGLGVLAGPSLTRRVP